MAPRKHLDKIKDEVEFYEHQIAGVRWGARRPSFILADEMGLAKTLSSATVAAVDFQRGIADRVLVVCPAFLQWNWVDELDMRTNFTSTVLHGTPTERKQILADFNTDFLMVGYETMRNELDALNKLGPWSFVILDEGHYIKGYKAKRSIAARQLSRFRGIILSGSPMTNQPNDLWALLNFCDPVAFPNYFKFVNRYCIFGGYKNKQIIGVKNKNELRGIVDKYLLRRLKRDCLDLPEKQVIEVLVDLHPDQRKLYDEMEAEMELDTPEGIIEADNSLTSMLRLKQIADSPALLGGLPDNSYKLDKMVEMVLEFTDPDSDSQTPVVVFTQFRGAMNIATARLEREGITVWQMHGDVKQPERQPLIKEWRDHAAAVKGTKRSGVIIVMLQMALGMNLTAANKSIFIDSLYSPLLNEQAEDRTHRIGASEHFPVQCFYIYARKTVEDRIRKILKSKRATFNKLIEAGDPSWKEVLKKELAKQVQAIAGTT